MPTLYELDRAICAVLENGFHVDEETGEVFFEGEDLEALEAERSAKLEAVACFIKNLDAEAAAIKAEETALAARRKAKEAKAERLRAYLANSLQNAGESRFETARCALSFRKSEAVEIMDESLLLPDYVSFKKVPNKAALKRALKNGAQLKGARLIVKQNIQVK
jgi:hypothetical protein